MSLVTRGFGEKILRVLTRGFGKGKAKATKGWSPFGKRKKEYSLEIFVPVLKKSFKKLSIFIPVKKTNIKDFKINSNVFKSLDRNIKVYSKVNHKKLFKIIDAI